MQKKQNFSDFGHTANILPHLHDIFLEKKLNLRIGQGKAFPLHRRVQSDREALLPARRAGHPSALLTYFLWMPCS